MEQPKKFTFWRENSLDQEFQLTPEELKEKFLSWMGQQDESYLDHYAFKLPLIFITNKDGLNSVYEDNELLGIERVLNDSKWEYLNSIGIK